MVLSFTPRATCFRRRNGNVYPTPPGDPVECSIVQLGPGRFVILMPDGTVFFHGVPPATGMDYAVALAQRNPVLASTLTPPDHHPELDDRAVVIIGDVVYVLSRSRVFDVYEGPGYAEYARRHSVVLPAPVKTLAWWLRSIGAEELVIDGRRTGIRVGGTVVWTRMPPEHALVVARAAKLPVRAAGKEEGEAGETNTANL